MPPPPPLPAHQTKHHPTLHYPLSPTKSLTLTQSDTTHQTGSTLWLSSQVLCEYLTHTLQLTSSKSLKSLKSLKSRKAGTPPCVLELGAGIGLTALVLGELGCRVVATDVAGICGEFLGPNVGANAAVISDSRGSVEVQELDWNDVEAVKALAARCEFDCVVLCDVVYESSLVPVLCETLSRFVGRKTVVYVAQEVRVPSLFEEFVAKCGGCGLKGSEVPAGEVEKIMEGKGWEGEDWEGVVVWKFRRKGDREKLDADESGGKVGK